MIPVMAVALLSIVATSRSAQAGPLLKLTDGTTTQIIADGDSLDSALMPGVVTFSGTIGNFLINVSTGISKPVLGNPALPQLDLNSINVTGAGTGTLAISFTDTDFTALGPDSTWYQSGIGGVVAAGGTLTYSTYLGTSNTPWGMDVSLGSGTFASGPFSDIFVSPSIVNNLPYSLTQVVSVTHTGSWQSSSFNATLDASVPEPGTLMLFGTGLMGLARLARGRTSKS